MKYEDIPNGWYSYDSYYTHLANTLPDNAVIAELGCFLGMSTIALAKKFQERNKKVKIYAIDTWNINGCFWMYDTNEHFFKTFCNNLKDCNVDSIVQPVMRDSIVASTIFENNLLDCVHIDVFVNLENISEITKKNITAWKPKVKKGGILSGHWDYRYFQQQKEVVKKTVGNVIEDYATVWMFVKND